MVAKQKTRKTKPKSSKKSTSVKTTAIKERYSKSEILTHIADQTELPKKQVKAVFDELELLIHRHLKKEATGEFVLPGLLKLVVQKKPAKKARKGINPFTGEEMMFKAKPARKVVKIRALKKLKEMV